MIILFIMLKLIHEVESKLAYRVLRLVRGTFGYGVDPTIDEIKILHDSPHFVVVNKRQDVIINHHDKDIPVTVEKQMERLYPDLVNLKLAMSFFFCHRLDYSTSGVLCIAKHKAACSAATKSFACRDTQKYYLAIVRGHLSQDFMTVDVGIGEDLRENFRALRMAIAGSQFCTEKWKDAVTHVAVIERGYCYGYPATKVVMKPVTGRRHQLRIHCTHIGHTIVGDYTYSNRRDLEPFRMFLHAFRLVLPNSVESLDIQTEDPFTPSDPRNKWEPQQKVHSLVDAMNILEKTQNDLVVVVESNKVSRKTR